MATRAAGTSRLRSDSGRGRRIAVDAAGLVAADPVAAVGVDGGAVGPAGRQFRDEDAAVVRQAAVDVVVEGPDHLPRRVRVGQVHGPAVGAEGQAVGHDQVVDDRFQRLAGRMAIQFAGVAGQAHVHDHGAGQEAALAVAAAVIEAHAGRAMAHRRQRPRLAGLAGHERPAGVQAVLHRQQPAVAARGEAAGHLRQRPVIEPVAGGRPAPQRAAGDVGPVEGLVGGAPHGAFAHAAEQGSDAFGRGRHGGEVAYQRGGKGNGPALTNAPPW